MAYPIQVNWQEQGSGEVVSSPAQLSNLLDRIAAEANPTQPPLVLIENEAGVLTIGVGTRVSTLNHVSPNGDPPYLICVGDDTSEECIDFYYCGHHTEFLRRNTISNQQARIAALEYAESGSLSDSVNWEEC